MFTIENIHFAIPTDITPKVKITVAKQGENVIQKERFHQETWKEKNHRGKVTVGTIVASKSSLTTNVSLKQVPL